MAITASGYNTNRITGMFSGMDTASLVTNMLSTEQSKYDKLFQAKEKAQWKYEAYNTLNNSVSSLRNSYLSVLGEKSVMSSAAYNSFKVNMAENSALKITGTATADPMNFKVISTKMATAASAISYVDSKQAEVTSVSGKYLQAQATGTMSLAGLDIGEDTTIGELAEAFGLESGQQLAFSINGKSFSFNQGTTLKEMQDAINAETGTTNVKMDITYSGNDGTATVKFTNQKIGADSTINFSNTTGTAFTDGSKVGAFGIDKGKAAQKSVVDVNSDTFKDLADKLGVTIGTGSTFSVNGQEFSLYGITVDGDGNKVVHTEDNAKTIQEVMKEVNDAGLGVNMSYDEATGTFAFCNVGDGQDDTYENADIKLEGGAFGASGVLGINAGTYSDVGGVKRSDTLTEVARKLGRTLSDSTIDVTINGKEFSFNANSTTLEEMMDAINADKSLGATFTYSELADSFKIASTETGSGSSVSFSGFEELFGIADGTARGSNAEMLINIDGEERLVSQSTNSFTLDGLQFDITGDETFDNGGMNVSVEQDYQATVDKVKAFIEDYNKMVKELNGKYYESTYREYAPLTDEQRSELTEKEAELWDEKAKSGVLKNDSTIGNLLTNLRSSLYVKVGDTGMSAYDLGITTAGWSTDWKTDQGTLVLDEEKLLAALKENPNAVQEVLTKIDTNADGTANSTVSGSNLDSHSESGLFVRMNSMLSKFNSTMRSQNILNAQNSVNDYSDKMDELLDKMSELEESYYAKFSALETALAELQSQTSYFSSMLGTGTTSSGS